MEQTVDNEDSTRKLKKESFYKQQQQRLQHITLNKDLSADQLIKNILEKVDTDAKITKYYNTQQYNNQPKGQWNAVAEQQQQSQITSNLYSPLSIPQCFMMNSEIPNIYLNIWNSVQNPDLTDFCNRDKLYQVLISSNLSNDVLAKLWSFVNRTKPGELTRNELFVMLALIGLVQQNVSNPLNELYTISKIPIPYFNVNQENDVEDSFKTWANSKDNKQEEQFFLVDDVENEFCDFKSADFVNTIESTKDEQVEDFIISTNESNSKNNENLFEFLTNETDIPNMKPPLLTEKNVINEDLFDTNEDKYSSLKNLELEDDFGDFQSQPIDNESSKVTHSQNETGDHLSIKHKILTSIKQVIHKTFNTLAVNHDEESVIEALSSDKGVDFSYDLNEVFQIACRIKQGLNELTINDDVDEKSMAIQCNVIIEEILNNWNSISNLLKKASINLQNDPVSSNEAKSNDQQQKCYICWTINSNKPTVWSSSFLYHTSCANFWLNFVDPNLLPHNLES